MSVKRHEAQISAIGRRAPASPDANAWIEQAHWQALSTAQLSGSHNHDQAILTLQSGTLALSATFLNDIAPTPVSGSLTLLVLSWAALIAAIVFVVLSFQASQWTMQGAMEKRNVSRRNKLTIALNIVSDIAFVGGIVLFAYFAFANF